MVDAWSSAPVGHQRAVLGALTQVGVPYRSNTSIENEGFDCSGLTTYAWSGAGVELFRQSGSQISEAKRLDRESAKAGDLVHYPGHVMLYLGVEDAIVHSVQTGRTVEVDTIRRGSVSFGDPHPVGLHERHDALRVGHAAHVRSGSARSNHAGSEHPCRCGGR